MNAAVAWLFSHPWSAAIIAFVVYAGVMCFVVAFVGFSTREKPAGTVPEYEPMDVDVMLACMMADPECVDNLIRDIFSS